MPCLLFIFECIQAPFQYKGILIGVQDLGCHYYRSCKTDLRDKICLLKHYVCYSDFMVWLIYVIIFTVDL